MSVLSALYSAYATPLQASAPDPIFAAPGALCHYIWLPPRIKTTYAQSPY